MAKVLLVIVLAAAGTLAILLRADAPSPEQVITVSRDLPAYTIIAEADLTTKDAIPPTDAVLDFADAIGKVTKQPIQEGTAVTHSTLISPRRALQNQLLLSVPLFSPSSLTTGEDATLLGIQKGQVVPTFYYDILNVKDEEVLVALPREEAKKAATYLLADKRLLVLDRVA